MDHAFAGIHGTLTAYLAASVRDHPEKIAVRDRQRRITYAELDEISNCVASALVSRRPVSGQRIGIWLNKSVEAIAAVYAVLRGGAAYVPIDPTAPARRAARMLADCGASWLITTPDRVRSLRACSPGAAEPISLMYVGDRGEAPPDGALIWESALDRHAGGARVLVPSSPDDVAYILYTSGSTGAPKGVALTHENARSFVDWAAQELALTSADVLASHAPLHFDLSVLDVFGAAACGGGVSLVPDSWQGLGPALVRLVADDRISVWYSVPSALRRMAESANSALLSASHLRLVAFAGEEYPVRHLKALRQVLPAQAALYNLYGPTETNVCTFHRLEASDLADDAAVAPPIGRPCPYATAFLLTEHGTVLPDSGEATGELCVGGTSVMRGYWNNADGTATSMISKDGARLYRTGDIVRRLHDGRYAFVGRNDGMVKIKGHRIELGEIEAALDSRPDVREAACVVTHDPAGAAQIVAFVTAVSGAGLDERDLRRHCRQLLPGYMAPDRIKILPTLSYTSTGKLDRQALALDVASGACRQPAKEKPC